MDVRRIVEACARAWGVPVDELFGRDRHKTISEARHACYVLIKEYHELSYPELGKLFKRDHTTVMSGVKAAHVKLQESELFMARFMAAKDGMMERDESADVFGAAVTDEDYFAGWSRDA